MFESMRQKNCIFSSVPHPKLLITGPDSDPQMENHEFRIRILDNIQLQILPLNYRLILKDLEIWQNLSISGHTWVHLYILGSLR